MALDKKTYESHEVVDKIKHVTATVTLTPRDQCVRAQAAPDTGPIVITLPNVGECRGLHFGIVARDADGTNTVKIQDQDESEYWSDITMNGPGDSVALFSDGYMWHVNANVTSGSGTTAT